MIGRDDIAVVTVNWNGWRNTLACLDALRASIGVRWHLFVVDNGSTDGSLDHLGGLGDNVTLIDAGSNRGWTGGNNLGLMRALDQGYHYALILNNDACVEPDTLAVLLRTAVAWPAAAMPPVLGPIHRGVHRSLGAADYDFVAAVIDPKTGIPAWVPPSELGSALSRPLTATAYISGAGIFAQRVHFESVGFFDDRFYLNFDDTDWCMRVSRAGFPLIMVRDASINHIGSASIGGRQSPLQIYFLTRNRMLFAEKHWGWRESLRILRRYIWQARDLANDGTRGSWPGKFLRSRAGQMAAFRQGLIDYALRRFGDCPPQIRRWQANGATNPAAPATRASLGPVTDGEQ